MNCVAAKSSTQTLKKYQNNFRTTGKISKRSCARIEIAEDDEGLVNDG
jgi:hypothetical protein